MKNRALLFGALGLVAGILLDEYWPTLLVALQRYDRSRMLSGQDSLVQNLTSFFYSALREKSDTVESPSSEDLFKTMRESILEGLARYARLKAM